jgi:hypothetical protein
MRRSSRSFWVSFNMMGAFLPLHPRLQVKKSRAGKSGIVFS